MLRSLGLTGRGLIPYGTRTLKEGIGVEGSPQGDVERLQVILGIKATGIFDARTTAAVKEWQKENGERLTNIVKEEGLVSEINNPRKRLQYGLAETYVNYVGDGIIDDDWALLLEHRDYALGVSWREGLPVNISNPPTDTSF